VKVYLLFQRRSKKFVSFFVESHAQIFVTEHSEIHESLLSHDFESRTMVTMPRLLLYFGFSQVNDNPIIFYLLQFELLSLGFFSVAGIVSELAPFSKLGSEIVLGVVVFLLLVLSAAYNFMFFIECKKVARKLVGSGKIHRNSSCVTCRKFTLFLGGFFVFYAVLALLWNVTTFIIYVSRKDPLWGVGIFEFVVNGLLLKHFYNKFMANLHFKHSGASMFLEEPVEIPLHSNSIEDSDEEEQKEFS
jgi:hypothetical protein